MPVFASSEELIEVMENLWKRIKADPSISQKLLQSKLCVRFHYRHPTGQLTVDGTDGLELKISTQESKIKPTIEMFMQSDLAHDFWIGKLNLAVAVMSGKIISRGPINQVLALLPVIKPAHSMYIEVFQSVKNKM